MRENLQSYSGQFRRSASTEPITFQTDIETFDAASPTNNRSMSELGFTSFNSFETIQSATNAPTRAPMSELERKLRVRPGDLLASLERFGRSSGRTSDMSNSLIRNGSLPFSAARVSVKPVLRVDESVRSIVRVQTGGAADRLHFSDGSMRVKRPPPALVDSAALAYAPIPLRLSDGSPATISHRVHTSSYASRRAAFSGQASPRLGGESPGLLGTAGSPQVDGGTEVTKLTRFHSPADVVTIGRKGGLVRLQSPKDSQFGFTTSLDPTEWEARGRKSQRARDQQLFQSARPDLEAIAEYYVLRKLHQEQAEGSQLWDRVLQGRDRMRSKLHTRAAEREALQNRAGQPVLKAEGDWTGIDHERWGRRDESSPGNKGWSTPPPAMGQTRVKSGERRRGQTEEPLRGHHLPRENW
mmetsp:Transcript_9818/g.23076  ORF Transcript_9818/g.23076 Transcript_9818/m.23076 type:complete len:413 (-) Transcript_9818:52-1290(-)